jgi:hypothetical protein
MKRRIGTFRKHIIPLTIVVAAYWIHRHRATYRQIANASKNANFRSYANYSTVHQSYRIWPDYLFEVADFPVVATLGFIVIAVFMVGLLIACPFGFVVDYVSTPAVYLGLAGIALVTGAIHWGSCRVHRDFESLRPVFTITDTEYLKMLDRWFVAFCSKKAAGFSSLVFFIIGLVGLVLAYVTSASNRQEFDLQLLRPILFAPTWYSHRFEVTGFSILFFYLVVISITLGTGCWLLLSNIIFLAHLRGLPVIPVPTIVRARLRRVANLYAGTSLWWSIGVILFGILSYKNYNIASGAFLASLFIIGVLMFVVPQALSSSYIIRSHELLCAMGLVELYKGLGMSLQERKQALMTDERLADNLSDMCQMTDRPKTLVYDVQNVALWLGSEILALAAILPHNVLVRLLHVLHA